MQKRIYEIKGMDCPAEEQLVRMSLDGLESVRGLDFDLKGRRVTVTHEGGAEEIEKRIHDLNLHSRCVASEREVDEQVAEDPHSQRRLLWAVLLINAAFFVIEIVAGMLAQSMGLVADSLDMLADAFVYGLGLYAVGGTVLRKKKIATASGYLQLFLGVLGLIEVLRRFLGFDVPPNFVSMIIVSVFALGGNTTSLYLLLRSKSKEAHLKASMICTSNDVIANVGVILAGVLVLLTDSNKPDLIVGMVVFLLVTRGAVRILRLGR